jgi:hypothetical protein
MGGLIMRGASIAVLLAFLGSLVSITRAEAQQDSPTWSGYMWKSTDLASTTFTDASGNWTVPAVSCPNTGLGPAAGVSFWVGLDAGGTAPLEQAGINVTCDTAQYPPQPRYEAFWRMYVPGKSNPTTHVFAVNAGDVIGARVSYANGSFTFVVSDSTSHQSYTSPPQACDVTAACPRGSVEWIVERPGDGAPLAQYACVPAACAEVPVVPGNSYSPPWQPGYPNPVEFTTAANGTGLARQLTVLTMVESGPPRQILSSCSAVPIEYPLPPRLRTSFAERANGFGATPSGGIICAWSDSDIVACDSTGCISEEAFCQNIANTLQNSVTGYAVLCGGMPPYLGGQARTSTDPPALAMQTNARINIASVSKTLTAIGVILALAEKKLPINAPIGPYIYSDWQPAGANVNAITFEDLLTQRSGFPDNTVCGGGNTEYSVLKTIIQAPVAANAPPVYSNCNFAIFRELLPILMQGQTGAVGSLPDGPQRAQASAEYYVNYMNQYVFAPVLNDLRACKPVADPSIAMLAYLFPPGATPGWDGGGDWTLSCGGGGWNLSTNDVYLILNDLANGSKLLTAAQKVLMHSNYLGWDNAVGAPCPSPNDCKNGNLPDNGNNIWTYAGIFKCTVPVAIIVNSVLPPKYQNGSDIIGLVEDAYNAAQISRTPTDCPPGSF